MEVRRSHESSLVRERGAPIIPETVMVDDQGGIPDRSAHSHRNGRRSYGSFSTGRVVCEAVQPKACTTSVDELAHDWHTHVSADASL